MPDGIAPWLGGIYAVSRPLSRVLVSAQLYHVGTRQSTVGDIDGYERVDATVSLLRLGWPGLSLRVGVDNALDQEILYLFTLPAGALVTRQQRRAWWLRLAYEL